MAWLDLFGATVDLALLKRYKPSAGSKFNGMNADSEAVFGGGNILLD